MSLEDGTLHSVDNESGPFDKNGKELDLVRISAVVRESIERFIDDADRPVRIAILRQGFLDGWNQVASNLSKLTGFDEREMRLIRTRCLQDRQKMAMIYFR